MKVVVIAVLSLVGIFYSPVVSAQRISDTTRINLKTDLSEPDIYNRVKRAVGNEVANDLFALFSSDSIRQDIEFKGIIRKKLSHIRITYFPQKFVNISIGQCDSYQTISFYPTWDSLANFLTYKRECRNILDDVLELYRQILYTENY